MYCAGRSGKGRSYARNELSGRERWGTWCASVGIGGIRCEDQAPPLCHGHSAHVDAALWACARCLASRLSTCIAGVGPVSRRGKARTEAAQYARDVARTSGAGRIIRKTSKSDFALVSGEGRADVATPEETLRLHARHNAAVEAFRGQARVRLVRDNTTTIEG